ncbi:TRAF3-interacting protein 1 [Balamuthia mandrillaris]
MEGSSSTAGAPKKQQQREGEATAAAQRPKEPSPSELESLHQRLDALLALFFQDFVLFRKAHQQLSDHLKQGLWQMGRARYALGGSAITPLQYDLANMRATLTFTETTATPKEDGGKEEEEEEEGGVLRQRRRGKKDEGEAEERKEEGKGGETKKEKGEEGEQKEEAKKNKSRSNDPLYWFGVLAPPALRHSQNHFRQAAMTALELARLKHRMQVRATEYDQLYDQLLSLTK